MYSGNFRRNQTWIVYAYYMGSSKLEVNTVKVVDWEKVDAFWRSSGSRQMPATLEVGGLQEVVTSLQYIKDHGFFGFDNLEE